MSLTGPAVTLDRARWGQLEQVQAAVNDAVRYADDRKVYGQDEFWEPAARVGDCEDYALAKRARLLALGWPPQALRIATAIDEKGALHAVLTVDVVSTAGRPGAYVLDNRFADVEPWQVLTGYRWVERQGPLPYAWTYLAGTITHRPK